MKGKPSRKNRAVSRYKKNPGSDQEIWQHFFGTDVMVEYLDATSKIGKAIEKGDKEVSLPAAFLAKWIPETVRMDDPEVAEAWNQSCDAVGMPDKKVPLPEPPRDPMVLNETLPVKHALPLISKHRDDEEEGGPF